MSDLSDPASRYFAITPHDSNNFAVECRGIYVGAAGNIAIVSRGGDVVTFVGAAAGSIIPVRAIRVNSTNTTATNLVGLYN